MKEISQKMMMIVILNKKRKRKEKDKTLLISQQPILEILFTILERQMLKMHGELLKQTGKLLNAREIFLFLLSAFRKI